MYLGTYLLLLHANFSMVGVSILEARAYGDLALGDISGIYVISQKQIRLLKCVRTDQLTHGRPRQNTYSRTIFANRNTSQCTTRYILEKEVITRILK